MRSRGRSIKLTLVLLASTFACKSSGPERDGGGAREAAPSEAEQASGPISHAREMTKSFATELQSTLLAAIEADGPASAIGVCKHAAPQIAAAQASEGWTLSRTALRVRNPGNAPTVWQRDVLLSWQAQLDAGEVEDVASLEWFELHDGQLRYMRAIPLGGVCLGCHGPVEQISDEVKAALAEQYPEDQATGFEVGQLRGAFVVTGPLD